VNYIFPRVRFVDETPLDKQLEHFASECKEIIERIEKGDFTGIVEEVFDMMHSGETFLRKAEEQHKVDVGLVREKVILKNDKRGYYEEDAEKLKMMYPEREE